MKYLTDFQETLKELLIITDKKQKELAAAIGMPPASVCRYLSGESIPTIDVLVKIADYFQCSTDFLLGFEKQNDAKTFQPCPHFCERLRFLLQHFHETGYSFCKGSEISDSCFYSWLNGKRKPTLENLVRIAVFFNCNVDYVLGRTNNDIPYCAYEHLYQRSKKVR